LILLTKKQIVIRIAIIFSLAEFLIMLLLQVIPHDMSSYAVAALDTILLSLFSIPAIYFWVIRPFVNARDAALSRISRLALTDPVTQLANRRLITTHLNRLIAGCVRHTDHGAVLLIDLDGFKLVNDNHGHEAGDAVLIEIAKRLQSMVRSEDIVGRLGGDEFIALLHRLGSDERKAYETAAQVAETLIKTISTPFNHNGNTIRVGASIGIRLLGFEELAAETAIREADRAMYLAKEAGGGCSVTYEN
jgi:diguanylate cyclase (GGDEF)-like protein